MATTTAITTRPAVIVATVTAMSPVERAELLRLLLSISTDVQPLQPLDDALPVGCPPGHEHRRFIVRGEN